MTVTLTRGFLLRLLVVLAIAFSLSSQPAPTLRLGLPTIRLAHADVAPSESWYPAGPAMDTFLVTIFSNQEAESVNMAYQPTEDIMDLSLTQDQVNQFQSDSRYYVTSNLNTEGGYAEIEFNLAMNFWGCDFNFGNPVHQTGVSTDCGRHIRQGIAHLIDKVKFANKEPMVFGHAVAVDYPLPADNGGVPTPNPCGWDLLFPQYDSGCHVGVNGGEAYHIASAAGVRYPWQQSLNSSDFCAAADHFVSAGLALSKDGNCVLRGVQPRVSNNPVTFLIVDDNLALLDLGESMAEEICALFTGSYTSGCGSGGSSNNILAVTKQPADSLSAQSTPLPPSGPNLKWGMFTSGPPGVAGLDVFQEVADHITALGCLPSPPSCKDPFDSSLFFVFNSKFASVASNYQIPNGKCSSASTPSLRASDYMYLCSPSYDSISSLMEYAPCISMLGDPTSGQTSPTFASCTGQTVIGTCTSSSSCSGVSAAYQTENLFGSNAYTIPVYDNVGQQYVYLHYTPGNPAATWQRVITHSVSGPTNYFTWLNAYNNAPAQPGTIRQMMGGSITTLNPYDASTPYDMMILGTIYDSLGATNPLADTQYLDWAATSDPQTSLSYTPPSGTVLTYRFSLDPNLSWQDGRSVTSFDVAFSYLSLVANGAFQSVGAASFMTGITILSPTQFDINVNSNSGLFSKIALTSLTIIPGRYWTCAFTKTPDLQPPCVNSNTAKTTWDSDVSSCTSIGNSCYPIQYTLGQSSGSQPRPVQCALTGCPSIPNATALMTADPAKVVPNYDPIQNHILIGSGPWTCGSSGSGLGYACAPGNVMNLAPGQSYAFQRYGNGVAPGFPGDYFRSGGMLATYLWSGDIQPGVTNFSAAHQCFGVPPVPLSSSPPDPNSCSHWQQGIGTNGATTAPGTGGCPGAPNTTPCGISVGSSQLAIVKLWINFNWVYPFVWNSVNPPQGIVGLDPVLYAGSSGTLSPAQGNGAMGCGSPYPAGGYDC